MEESIRIVFPDGKVAYEGDMKNGIIEGEGTLFYRGTQNPQYIGQWQKNVPEGNGKSFYPDGSIRYDGQWKNGLYDGFGTLYDEKGSVKYEGEYKKSYLHGEGRLFDSEGYLVYAGSFVWSRKEGIGKEYFKDGSITYEGEWINDRPGGKGKKYHPNGNVWYEGEFFRGESDGQGKAYFENGKIAYDGGWKNGVRHGYGKLYDVEGHIEYYGQWKHGEIAEDAHIMIDSMEDKKNPECKSDIFSKYNSVPVLLESGGINIDTQYCISPYFLPFSDSGEDWNPFIATLKQYESDPHLCYEESVLKKFYDSYPRENLQQAYLLPTNKEFKPLWDLDARAIFPLPWSEPEAYARFLLNTGFIRYNQKSIPTSEQNISEIARMVFDLCLYKPFSTWVPRNQVGMVFDMNHPGFTEFGPVEANEGEAVFRKLIRVYENIRTIGYLPGLFPFDQIMGTILLTEGKYRFIVHSGLFLLTALAALGLTKINASFSRDNMEIVEQRELSNMPFVAKGIYSLEIANLLFEHAFKSFKRKIAER
jgi:antitoxin component YwqK of YwqJK toxin-antitoxin module